MFSLTNTIFPRKTEKKKCSSTQRDITCDETRRFFFSLCPNFFHRDFAQSFSTKTKFWIFGPQQPEFFLSQFEKAIFFNTKSSLSVTLDIQKTVFTRVANKFPPTVRNLFFSKSRICWCGHFQSSIQIKNWNFSNSRFDSFGRLLIKKLLRIGRMQL